MLRLTAPHPEAAHHRAVKPPLRTQGAFYGQCFGFGINRPARATQLSFAARGMAMAKSGVKPLIFLIAVSVMAWATGMAIHGF